MHELRNFSQVEFPSLLPSVAMPSFFDKDYFPEDQLIVDGLTEDLDVLLGYNFVILTRDEKNGHGNALNGGLGVPVLSLNILPNLFELGEVVVDEVC